MGIVVGSGGYGYFRNCGFRDTEDNTGVDVNNMTYWAAMLQALDGAQIKLVGCQFGAANTSPAQRPTYGLMIMNMAKAEILATTDTLPVQRCSFSGFTSGVYWQFGASPQVVDAADFSNCTYNVLLFGNVTGRYTLNNTRQYIHFDPSNPIGAGGMDHLTVNAAGQLTLAPGSELRGWEPHRLTVEKGGSLIVDHARTEMATPIIVQGSVSANDSIFNMATYRLYYSARAQGFEIQPGASGVFRNCSLITHEQTTYTDMGYWASAIEVFAADTANKLAAGSLSLDGCFLGNPRSPYGYITPYGIIDRSNMPTTITNSLFSTQHRALYLDSNQDGAELNLAGNDFLNSTDYGVYVVSGAMRDARYNYWGSPTGPRHVTNPGGTGDAITDLVDYAGGAITPNRPLVRISDPMSGQLLSGLGAGALQCNTPLAGIRFAPGGSEIRTVAFLLSGVSGGFAWEQLDNFRLYVDANGDGTLNGSETDVVGGIPEVVSDGANRILIFREAFISDASSAVNYILVADARRMAAGHGFNVQLDGRYLEAAPGVGIQDLSSPTRQAMGGVVLLGNPVGGQVSDGLNGLGEQTGVSLFGFRLAGAAKDVQSLTFNLSGVSGLDALNFVNLRLVQDLNGNGSADPGETAVGGVPAVTLSSGTGTIAFSQVFKSGASFVLTSDLTNLTGGAQFTVALTADKVVLPASEAVSGSATPVTHQVNYPVLLTRTTEWTPPDYFGKAEIQSDMPLLGFQLNPTGINIRSFAVSLSNVIGFSAGDISNARLYWDRNGDNQIDGNDVLLAGGGVVQLSGGSGQITFSTPFITRGNMILLADLGAMATGDELTLSVAAGNVTLDYGMVLAGSLPDLRYTVGAGVASAANKNMNWTLTWRSPGGNSCTGRYNHQGNYLIEGYDTGSAWIYDSLTNKPLIMLKDHYDSVKYAGFNSDDTAAVTVTKDGAVYIWDLNTSGTLRSAMFSDLLVDYAVPSPDFRKLMVVTQGKAVLLDLDTQQRLWEYIPGAAKVLSVAYSVDGANIAVGQDDKRAYLLNATNGSIIQSFSGQTQAVTTVGFTGDGAKLMTSSTDGTVQIWQISPKRVLRTIGLGGQPTQGAAFSKDGTRVAIVTDSGSSAQMRIHDASTGLELFHINLTNTSLGNWGGTLTNVAFDDAGVRVLVNSSSGGGAFNAAFRVDNGAYLGSWGPVGHFVDPTTQPARPRISGDGERVFYQTDWGLNLLFRSLNKPIRRSAALTSARAFGISGDGNKIAWLTGANANRLLVASVTEGGFATSLDVPVTAPYYGWNPYMSKDGSMVATGDRLFSSKTGQPLATYPGVHGDYSAAFSQDNRMWGFWNDNSIITMLTSDPEATNYKTIYTDTPVNYPAFKILYHPDGARVASVFRSVSQGYSGVQMYDMNTELPVGLYRFEGQTYDAEISADGTMLLIGGDNNVRLYDVKTGRILRYFYPMHSSMASVRVNSVQFAKNDNLIMIAWNYNYVETYERTRAAGIEISPATRSLAIGQSQTFTVEVVNDDSTRRDITPYPGEQPVVKLEILPASRATVKNNVITVNPGAFGQFTVRTTYREGERNFTADAVVDVRQASLVSLKADPVKLALNPGVFRPIRYTARYDDGYQTEVTTSVTLTADLPDYVEIQGQNVKVLFTAMPGEIKVSGSYTDPSGAKAFAQTSLIAFGPKTLWERYQVTGGGYGLSGDFSPDGKQLAAGSSSGAVTLYDVGVTPTQYAIRNVLIAHEGPVIHIGYLANGRILTVGAEGKIKTWATDSPTTTPLTVFTHDAMINTARLRVESGAKLLALGDKMGRVGLFDVDTQAMKWLVTPHSGEVLSVALDADSVLSGSADTRARILNRATGAVLKNIGGHTRDVLGVGYFDGTTIYTLSKDRTLARWNKSKGDIIDRYEYNAEPTTAITIGGQLYVATKGPNLTWVYNSSGLLLRQIEHPPDEGVITHYMMDPNGLLLTGRKTGKKTIKLKFMGMDAGEKEVISPFSSFQFWETGRGIFRGSLAHSFPLSDAHATDDGSRVYTQDAKRTMAWIFGPNTMTSATRLMETGYFIAPRFESMSFTADSSILATRVGPSIFMYDTAHNLLWKSLHTPGGPLAISPLGTRMATADTKVRLWDLANLSMIREEARVVGSLGFQNENNFAGSIPADNVIGIWNASGLLFQVIQTQNTPANLYLNRAGDRLIAITTKTSGDELSKTVSYYAEVFDIHDLSKEPPLVNTVFLLTQELDMDAMGQFSGPTIGFSLAISEDATLSIVGASGDQPAKLINMNDGSTIREFLPPTGSGDENIGAAALGFLAHDTGMMLGWAEGYVELWRRMVPKRLDLSATALDMSQIKAKPGLARKAGRLVASTAQKGGRPQVQPGQMIQLQSQATYSNGKSLDVTPSSAFTSDYPAGVFFNGSMMTIAPTATARMVTITGQYNEVGTQLQAQLVFEIVGSPLSVTGISRAGYSLDLLAPGKLVYADQSYVFGSQVPQDCLYQLYLKGLNADRDLVSSNFLSFTVNHPVLVVVAVDDRMVGEPAWLKSWQPRTLPLGTNDSHATRRLYQKSFPAGLVTLGSNRDATMATGNSMYTAIILDRSATGTVVVNPSPAGAPWTLSGPDSFIRNDQVATTITGAGIGVYTIDWKPLAGWDQPPVARTSQTLAKDATITFAGNYTRQTGSLQVPPSHPPPRPPPGRSGNCLGPPPGTTAAPRKAGSPWDR